jgi:hypothetical protein
MLMADMIVAARQNNLLLYGRDDLWRKSVRAAVPAGRCGRAPLRPARAAAADSGIRRFSSVLCQAGRVFRAATE